MNESKIDDLQKFWHHSPYLSKFGKFPPDHRYTPPLLPEFEISVEETNVNMTRPQRGNFSDEIGPLEKRADFYDEIEELESLAVIGSGKNHGNLGFRKIFETK